MVLFGCKLLSIHCESLDHVIYTVIRLKKRGLFLGPFFLKTHAAGRLFILIFIKQKTDVGTFFFRNSNNFFGYHSSQAIKLDSESLCTLSRFDFNTYA